MGKDTCPHHSKKLTPVIAVPGIYEGIRSLMWAYIIWKNESQKPLEKKIRPSHTRWVCSYKASTNKEMAMRISPAIMIFFESGLFC